ncbi:programmed cell death protein 10 [Lingula anatina]|uniref:Programmed cell death protein 10 n=1 Tax=Lingula anatina TaxID=7574 RepID=A0A1S3KAQ5_LINAN|nr:programmed cell death protein 10 [Lingula anatina]|eukprot:XP_013419705.1 programmed cell death protein 10 [Lingula anatina]
MTMGDEALFASMVMPVVFGPILEKLEKRDIGAAQTLRAALTKAETNHPGLAYDMVKGILRKAELAGKVDMCESLLRLEGLNQSDEFRIDRPEPAFQELNQQSATLKKILSRIPDEIYDRRKFLETIKDIASAIKTLLDAVNSVVNYIQGPENKQLLDQRKREFVKYSKRFSNTLKEFFKNNQKSDVFLSANYLVNQTSVIMKTVKAAC